MKRTSGFLSALFDPSGRTENGYYSVENFKCLLSLVLDGEDFHVRMRAGQSKLKREKKTARVVIQRLEIRS